MSKNYYQTLQLTRACTDFDIMKAYKKLSLRFHPTKTKEDKLVANTLFHEVAEAYEVLSDFKKRSCYDQLGEFGLKNGGLDGRGGYKYLNNADEIFQTFFKSKEIIAKLMHTEEIEGSLFGTAMRGMDQPKNPRPLNLEVIVGCSLEELYNGCSKRIEYERQVLNDDNSTLKTLKCFKDLQIRRGMKANQQLVFEYEGHMSSHYPPSNLIFTVFEQRHPNYKRLGNDLIYTHKTRLIDCILANPIEVLTLDGRKITVSFESIIAPDTIKTVQGEGMPIDSLTPPLSFGDLTLKFQVTFPKYLSCENKEKALRILS